MQRLIFHVDVNSAYLSWEAVRRLRAGEPDLRLIPSAIGGDREKRTGVILSKSQAAKKFGVKTGEPVGAALRKCPQLVRARPDFKLYHENSQAFVAICRDFAPVVEQFSIDECFLDMSGTGWSYPDPVQAAVQLKDTIRERLGFTVNVGVSTNKLLAKMASDFEKPDRVHTLFPAEIETKMWPLPVGDLFSVGRHAAEKLSSVNIRTIGELARAGRESIQMVLGKKAGLMVHAYANGIDDSPVLPVPEEAKGYSISTTLEENVTEREQANNILLALSDGVSRRMRADGAKAGCISVTIRSSTFQNRSHQKKLYEPTDITSEIYEVARGLFAELWDTRTPLRLLGIALTDIEREGSEQQSLFADERRERSRKLDKTVDGLRVRFGNEIISRGSNYGSGLNVGKKYKAQLDGQEEEKT